MKITFEQPGDFQATFAAENWLKDHGYSVGWTQRDAPRGVLRGEYEISKWRNLTDDDRAWLDGTVTGSLRNGPITVELFEKGDAACSNS